MNMSDHNRMDFEDKRKGFIDALMSYSEDRRTTGLTAIIIAPRSDGYCWECTLNAGDTDARRVTERLAYMLGKQMMNGGAS